MRVCLLFTLLNATTRIHRTLAQVESHLSRVDALAKQLTELQTTAALKTELGMVRKELLAVAVCLCVSRE